MSRRLFAVFLALSAAALTSCSDGGGTALGGSLQTYGISGFDHAQVGDEYWVSLPQMSNTSGEPLTVLSGKIAHVPAGLHITGYRINSSGGGGHPLGPIRVGDAEAVDRAGAHKGSSIPVKAHDTSDLYYEARVKVTGTVRGDLTTCRYTYRQGSTTYHQDLRCDTRIRLGKPLDG
ncbi:MAG: hypothetical protein JF597_23550 [Streptomyces sp.]|uniref:hypothetical protein n=1 Tax=Streptomyces sp. TaxID=1931 RepID=UPI0025CD85F5|nr:hypothetical protein [Streptomyces sp.]MBW8796460.1 hypothetical protein [Streptomyces sp.]